MVRTDTATSSRTNESSQPSEHGPKFDVFLSHSGKQKKFVRQLYTDLTNQGVSCFFDEDRESLPVGEPFPPRIFGAVETCKVAVLLLSNDFLESKWPMLELSAFVEAKDITRKNPNLKILPLFFKISPDALTNTKENDEKWKQLKISRETPAQWHKALHEIRRINGLKFTEDGNEVEFRKEIVKAIWQILGEARSPRYHVRSMQGEARMCQEVAEFFNKVQPNEKGILIAGLYGIAGRGKTTLCKAFCNFKLGDFEGKVCHLEFSRGDSLQRAKLALQYLTHRPQSYVQTLTDQDLAQVELNGRVKGQRVLLVLDNITEESIDEVMYYLKVDLGEKSHILLSTRSLDVLEKHFQMDKQSCMRVPRLEEEEAIAILLERTRVEVSMLGADDRDFALMCAKRCLFKEKNGDIVPRAQAFHPLALKAFGGYLLDKYLFKLSKWVDEVNGMVDRPRDGLDEVFAFLAKGFEDMPPEYRTIFMLLTVYILPDMSLDKAAEWLAINCNEEISFIKKAVEDLCKKAFIEEFEPEIRIHDLYIEFAQSKAEEMGKWLWWKGDGKRSLISKCGTGFELARLEQCTYPSVNLNSEHLGNLFVLQLVDMQDMSKLDLGPMGRLRSITVSDCELLAALDGIEKLQDLAWLQIREVNPKFKLPKLSSLQALQYLEINIADSEVLYQLGDLTHCFRLKEIYVVCPSLLEFPRLKGMEYLEIVDFRECRKVTGRLDCTGCVNLQSIVLYRCSRMAASPLLGGCEELSKIELSGCDAMRECLNIDAPSALKTLELFNSSKAASAPKNLEFCNDLENLKLWNRKELMELPSLTRLSNLTVLKLRKCGLRKLQSSKFLSNLTLLVLVECDIREPPDLTFCVMLEDIRFSKLKKLVSFPKLSSLRELKKLELDGCSKVKDPPDISGCHKMKVFHLIDNDNMEGLPKIGDLPLLQEIDISWNSKDEATHDSDGESLRDATYKFKYEELQNLSVASVAEALKEWQWLKGKRIVLKRCFRRASAERIVPNGISLQRWFPYYSLKVSPVPIITLGLDLCCAECKRRLRDVVLKMDGVDTISIDRKKRLVAVSGTVDPVHLSESVRRIFRGVSVISVGN